MIMVSETTLRAQTKWGMKRVLAEFRRFSFDMENGSSNLIPRSFELS